MFTQYKTQNASLAYLVQHTVLITQQGEQHAVDPAPRHDGVQAAHYQVEGAIELVVEILDLVVVAEAEAKEV